MRKVLDQSRRGMAAYKRYFKTVFGVSLMLSSIFYASCGEDECPDADMPDIQQLSAVQKARFPYAEWKTLIYQIEDAKRTDTVVLHQSEAGQRHFYTKWAHDEDGCFRGYYSIEENDFVRFESTDGNDRDNLEFKNKRSTLSISVHFNDDSLGLSHGYLDRIMGESNELDFQDTVMYKGQVFERATRGYIADGQTPFSTNFIYQADVGFVYIRDKNSGKRWLLLDAN